MGEKGFFAGLKSLLSWRSDAENAVQSKAEKLGAGGKPVSKVIALSELSDLADDQLPPVTHVTSLSDIPATQNLANKKILRPTYRPYPRGIFAHSVDHIFCCYGDLIHQAAQKMPLTVEEVNAHYIPVLRNFIAYVHLLPASKFHHHSGIGGLLTHSLETAYYSMTLGQRKLFDKAATPTQSYHNKKRWMFACYLAGLLHDIGKPVKDIIVTNETGEYVWNAREETLSDWLIKRKVRLYSVIWRDERVHNEHQAAALWVAKDIVPKETREWFMEYGTELIWEEIETALTNPQAAVESDDEAESDGERKAMVAGVVLKADSTSTKEDTKERSNFDEDELSIRNDAARDLVTAFGELVTAGVWKFNTKGGRLWVTRHGTFLIWGKRALKELMEQLRNVQKTQRIPENLYRIQQILEDSGVIRQPPKGSMPPGDPRWPVLLSSYKDMGYFYCLCLKNPKQIFNCMVLPEPELAIVPGIMPTEDEKAAWIKAHGEIPNMVLKLAESEGEAEEGTADYYESDIAQTIDDLTGCSVNHEELALWQAESLSYRDSEEVPAGGSDEQDWIESTDEEGSDGEDAEDLNEAEFKADDFLPAVPSRAPQYADEEPDPASFRDIPMSSSSDGEGVALPAKKPAAKKPEGAVKPVEAPPANADDLIDDLLAPPSAEKADEKPAESDEFELDLAPPPGVAEEEKTSETDVKTTEPPKFETAESAQTLSDSVDDLLAEIDEEAETKMKETGPEVSEEALPEPRREEEPAVSAKEAVQEPEPPAATEHEAPPDIEEAADIPAAVPADEGDWLPEEAVPAEEIGRNDEKTAGLKRAEKKSDGAARSREATENGKAGAAAQAGCESAREEKRGEVDIDPAELFGEDEYVRDDNAVLRILAKSFADDEALPKPKKPVATLKEAACVDESLEDDLLPPPGKTGRKGEKAEKGAPKSASSEPPVPEAPQQTPAEHEPDEEFDLEALKKPSKPGRRKTESPLLPLLKTLVMGVIQGKLELYPHGIERIEANASYTVDAEDVFALAKKAGVDKPQFEAELLKFGRQQRREIEVSVIGDGSMQGWSIGYVCESRNRRIAFTKHYGK